MVGDLKNEIIRLERILEEKKRHSESLRCENKKIVDHYRKVADDQKKTFREEKLSLEKQIKKTTEDLLFAEKEMGELTRTNLKLDILQQQYSKAMVEDMQMSKKIEILEDELAEKENTITDLRKIKPMTREEVEEELKIIMKYHEKKLDDLCAMVKLQKENMDALAEAQMASIKQQEEKIDILAEAQMASTKQQTENIDCLTEAQVALTKQQKEKIDTLTEAQMASTKQQKEKIDILAEAQMASTKQQTENIDSLTEALTASTKQQNENTRFPSRHSHEGV